MNEITLTLTSYQAGEIQCGLDIDAADHSGEPLWGRIIPVGDHRGRPQAKRRYRLIIAGTQLARDRALYRITSSRDICLDNARDRLSTGDERRVYAAHGRSLQALTRKLVAAAGGPEGFSEDVRHWIRY